MFNAPSTLNALGGGRNATKDCEWMAPDDYHRCEFVPRSESRHGHDENAFHLARLVLDCDDRMATLVDAITLGRLVQCGIRTTNPTYVGSLFALITTSARGGFHFHFADVLLATKPADSNGMSLAVGNLLRWVRRATVGLFARLPDNWMEQRSTGPPRRRIDVDENTLRHGRVRMRVYGTAKPDRPDDSVHRVVAVLSDDGFKVNERPRDNDDSLWWCQCAPDLSLASLSVRPNSTQIARFMANPHASLLRMTCGSPFYIYKHVPRCELASPLDPIELVEIFFTMQEPEALVDAVRLAYVDPHMAVAELRRAPGDGVDCAPCLSRGGGACCGVLYSLMRWHANGRSGVVGDKWLFCSASPGVVVSATSRDSRIEFPEWQVLRPIVCVPEVGSSSSAHLMSMPIGSVVYEKGFSLGGGVRTHDRAEMLRRYGFVALARQFCQMEGYNVDQLTSTFREVPLVERVERYRPSPDDPEESTKPKLSRVFAAELAAASSGGEPNLLRLLSVHANTGAGKTTMMMQFVEAAVSARGGRGLPVYVLAVTATRAVSTKLNTDLRCAVERFKHVVSYYRADGRGDGGVPWTRQLENCNLDVVVRVSSLNNSLLRSAEPRRPPDFLLFDESEHGVDYATVSPTLGGASFHGVVPPSHAEVCCALARLGARTKHAVFFCDRDAGISSRYFAAYMAFQCAKMARDNETLCRPIEFIDLRLDIRTPERFVELPSGNYKRLCALVNHFVFEDRKRVILADTTVGGVEQIGKMARRANARLHDIGDGFPDSTIAVVHAKADNDAVAEAIAREPDAFVAANDIRLLAHTGRLSRGTSFDKTRLDKSVMVVHRHTEFSEDQQLRNRLRLLSEQLSTGVRTTFIHFSRDMDKAYCELSRLYANVPLGAVLAACEENLLRRHGEQDWQLTKPHRQLLERSVAAVHRDLGSGGQSFIKADCPLSILAVMHTARRFVGCQLKYAVYRQEVDDNEHERLSLEQFDPALFESICQSAESTSAANKSLLYEQLQKCASGVGNKADREGQLRRLGIIPMAPNREQEEDQEERDDGANLPRCVPNRDLARHSPTFVFSMVTGLVDHELLRIYAFLRHQNDDVAGQLLPRLRSTIRAAIAKPRSLRAQDAVEKLELATLTQVLLLIGCLRCFQVMDVHAYPTRGPRHQYRHDFVPERFNGAVRVLDPWPPHAEMSGDDFASQLIEKRPMLWNDYRMCRGVRSSNDKTKFVRALMASIVNAVLGCAVMGPNGAVRSNYLWYKAAVLPLWAVASHVNVDDLYEWLDTLGDVWAPVFEYEVSNGRPLRPFAHPAHARKVQTALDDFAPPGEESDRTLRQRARVAAAANAAIGDNDVDGAPSDSESGFAEMDDAVDAGGVVLAAGDRFDVGASVSESEGDGEPGSDSGSFNSDSYSSDSSESESSEDGSADDEFDINDAVTKERAEELEVDEDE
jgi:hypothetical protein